MVPDRQPPTQSTASGPESIREPRLLLVEGREDLVVFRELCDHWGLEGIQIIEMEGAMNLRARLNVLARDPGFRNLHALGIARDADDDAQRAFQSVRTALGQCPPLSTGLPSAPGTRGGVRPATTVFIVPDNTSPGNLESMLNRTRANDQIDGCIDEYFACLSQRAEFDLAGGRLDKARAHARIAVSTNPARSVGHSLRASGMWDLDHEALTPAKTFLSGL